MSGRADDYVSEIGFTRGYFPEMSLPWIRLALVKAGIAPPEICTACELGFGQGVSLAIHSAASSTRWYGTDFNPEHATKIGRSHV